MVDRRRAVFGLQIKITSQTTIVIIHGLYQPL